MRGVCDIVSWALARGRRPQAFLDAWWVPRLLARVHGRRQVRLARRLLALSPHYFLDRSSWRARDEVLVAKVALLQASRSRLFDALLAPVVSFDTVLLDYGCGPGWLAKAASTRARHVIAADIASGVLACARVLNAADNVTYLNSGRNLEEVPDASLDVVCSVAVLQHLSSDAVDECLRVWQRTLVAGGHVVVHVVLDTAGGWRQEAEWLADTSVTGRLRYHLGLHCFARSAAWYTARFAKHGFGQVVVVPVQSLTGDIFDDVCTQHVVMARRIPASA